jgi:hypothetical protein
MKDDWIHDWNAGQAVKLWHRQMVWRERWDTLRHWGWPIATAIAVIALWLNGRL